MLGKALFTLFMLPSGNIIQKHAINSHYNVDDTQLYLSLRLDETSESVKLQACLKDTEAWMICIFLLLTSDKVEVIFLGPKPLRKSILKDIIPPGGFAVVPGTTARNLGVILNQDM